MMRLRLRRFRSTFRSTLVILRHRRLFSNGPLSKYESLARKGNIKTDPSQVSLLAELDRLHDELRGYEPESSDSNTEPSGTEKTGEPRGRPGRFSVRIARFGFVSSKLVV
jgi:hypothetical protein